MTEWSLPQNPTEEMKDVVRKDMAFATAISALEDLKARMVEIEKNPSYILERDGYDDRADTAYQVACLNVDEAFKPFIGNITMTGLKNAFDARIGDGFDNTEDVDDLIALVRAARVMWGTW